VVAVHGSPLGVVVAVHGSPSKTVAVHG